MDAALVLQDLGVSVNGKAHNRSVEDDFRHLHTHKQAQSIPHFRVPCCYLSFSVCTCVSLARSSVPKVLRLESH